jgi:hypothetical protein
MVDKMMNLQGMEGSFKGQASLKEHLGLYITHLLHITKEERGRRVCFLSL